MADSISITPDVTTRRSDQTIRQQLSDLAQHLDHSANRVSMALHSRSWHIEGNIPGGAGWYFIETDTPVEVLQRQHLPQLTYKTKTGKTAPVKSYDIAGSASRYSEDLRDCWNTQFVYSGLASNLKSRARQHTFSDFGTAALNLCLYPELKNFQWTFCYVELQRFLPVTSCPTMLLTLGEQVWRASNGWPLLSRA